MNIMLTRINNNLTEWSTRIEISNFDNLGSNLNLFIQKIKGIECTKSLLDRSILLHYLEDNDLQDLWYNYTQSWDEKIRIKTLEQRASISIQLFNWLEKKYGDEIYFNIMDYGSFHNGGRKSIDVFYKTMIEPLLYYLTENISEGNLNLYLIERYKKRVEWFTKRSLILQYESATKNYEDNLEHDLRLFLFDQGVEFPLSNPNSPSGRADIVSNVDSVDSLVVEIKITDKNKGYGKNRIKDGITQVISYVNDFSKPIGYLVVFNFDDVIFQIDHDGRVGETPRIESCGKTIFVVIINLKSSSNVSKKGTLKPIVISKEELIDQKENI